MREKKLQDIFDIQYKIKEDYKNFKAKSYCFSAYYRNRYCRIYSKRLFNLCQILLKFNKL